MCFGHFVWPQNTKVLKCLLQVPFDGNRIVPTGRVRRGPSLLPRILLKSESDHPGSRSGTRRPSDLAQKTQFFQIFCGWEMLNQSVETYKLSLLCSVLHLHWNHLVTIKFWTIKNNKFIFNQILFQVLHKCFGLRMLFTFVPLGFVETEKETKKSHVTALFIIRSPKIKEDPVHMGGQRSSASKPLKKEGYGIFCAWNG